MAYKQHGLDEEWTSKTTTTKRTWVCKSHIDDLLAWAIAEGNLPSDFAFT
jgi:hypothetical protein